MKKTKNKFLGFLIFCTLLFVSCSKPINTVQDSHFTKDGFCLDSVKEAFCSKIPSGLTFYVEVSGSMNGFFRANKPTKFKHDVWSIVSNFGGNDVNIISNSGDVKATFTAQDFRSRMNSGAFQSNQETLIPTMLTTILNGLDYSRGECAILISDMKYSPERQAAMPVLLQQYQVDIRNIIGQYKGLALSLIMSESEYLDRNGNVLEARSPYFYLIMGKDSQVAFLRNHIGIILEDAGNYVESVDFGFNYKAPSFEYGIPRNCIRKLKEPTFISYNPNVGDTCKILLKLDLSDYRWILSDENVLRENIKVKSLYGASVTLGNIKIDKTNHLNKEFERQSIAEVELNVYNMFRTESDVIEWSLEHSDFDAKARFTDAISNPNEQDLSGAFSVDKLVGGIFNAIQNQWDKTPNRVLISKNK